MHEREGVIQYQIQLERQPLQLDTRILKSLNQWRAWLKMRAWLGQDAHRYQGLGFGNLSVRTPDGFLISASQTGALAALSSAEVSEVIEADPARNLVRARGQLAPSSEALTHAAVYQAQPLAQAVIHVHAPQLWQARHQLLYPQTCASIGYGTPAMAQAIGAYALQGERLIMMNGHTDGILTWGQDLIEASLELQWAQQRLASLS